MKRIITTLIVTALVILGGVIAPTAQAVPQTWNSGSGTWTTGVNGWNGNTTWTAGDTASFAGADGAYTITIGGDVTTGNGGSLSGGLNFSNSGYTLSASSARTITLGTANTSGYITLSSGKTATIGSNVSVTKGGGAGSIAILGGGTLTISSGGTLQDTYVNASEVANGATLKLDGGVVSFATSLVIGKLTANLGTSGNLIVDSGTLTISANNLNVGRTTGDTSVATLNNGVITVANNLNFGNGTQTPTATFNLNGGTLTVKQVTDTATANSTFNFNGGTLKAQNSATATFMTGLDNAYVKSGGAKLDTNGQDLNVGQALLNGGSFNNAYGGLTKLGSGGLTLTSSANSYIGNTTIDAGALTLADNAGLQFVIGASGVNNQITGTGTVNLDGDFTFNLGGASTTVGDSWTIVTVGSLTETFGATFTPYNGASPFAVVDATTWTTTANLATYKFDETTGVLSVIPEPSALALVGLGLLGAALVNRRFRR